MSSAPKPRRPRRANASSRVSCRSSLTSPNPDPMLTGLAQTSHSPAEPSPQDARLTPSPSPPQISRVQRGGTDEVPPRAPPPRQDTNQVAGPPGRLSRPPTSQPSCFPEAA